MEEMGLLKRYQEGRSNYLQLTADGQQLHDKVVPAHEELIATLMSELTASEITELQRLLRKLDHALR